MRPPNFSIVGISAVFASSTFGQGPPPIIADWLVEDGTHIGDVMFYGAETSPYWIRIHHQNADYFSAFAGFPGSTSPPYCTSSALAVYDSAGTLLATVTSPINQVNPIYFGRLWEPGFPGSPVMLLPNEFYYIGIAPGGTIFNQGFSANLAPQTGRIRIVVAPTAGTTATLAVLGVSALRRRRPTV